MIDTDKLDISQNHSYDIDTPPSAGRLSAKPHSEGRLSGKPPAEEEGSETDEQEADQYSLDRLDAYLYFDDGIRRVDYIIVFKEQCTTTAADDSENPTKLKSFLMEMEMEKEMEKEREKKVWRYNFISGLMDRGIQIEEAPKNIDSTLHESYVFLKLHAPWDTLATIAELIGLKMPLAPEEVKKSTRPSTKSFFSWFTNTAGTQEQTSKYPSEFMDSSSAVDHTCIDEPPPTMVTSPFSCARQDQFLIEDKATFFSPAQRIKITHYILSRMVFDQGSKSRCAKFGIEKLKSVGAISVAYPLHSECVKNAFNVNNLLRGTWRHLFKSQASKTKENSQLDIIREYFGEKVGFFFCWMAFYTNMLIPLTIVGAFVFFFGVTSAFTAEYIQDICDTSGKGSYSMCPVNCQWCDDTCPNKTPPLSDSCTLARISSVFDNDAVIFNALFVMLWSFVFMKLWKRRASTLQIQWHVRDYKSQEVLRPELYTYTEERIRHPITDELEPFVSRKDKCTRRVYSTLAVALMMAVVLGTTIGLTELGNIIECHLNKPASIGIGSLLSLLVVVFFAKIYSWFCTRLTDFEMHRTESDWENSFRLKYFFFCFINNNAAPFYQMLRYLLSNEHDITGIAPNLSQYLLVYMIAEPIVLYLTDYLMERGRVPHLKTKKKKNIGLISYSLSAHQLNIGKDFVLEDVPTHILTQHYTDLVVQYGFVTIYAAVFPVAAICAVIRNVLAMSHLATQYSTKWRRPVPERVQDIGIYYNIVNVISYFSIFYNSYLILTETYFIHHVAYIYSEFDSYVDFRFRERQHVASGSNKTCRADYEMGTGEDGYFIRDFYRTYTIGFIFVVTISVIMLIFATLVDKNVSDIPKVEHINIRRENYLAQKVLRQYLTKGTVTKEELKEETHSDEYSSLLGNFHVVERQNSKISSRTFLRDTLGAILDKKPAPIDETEEQRETSPQAPKILTTPSTPPKDPASRRISSVDYMRRSQSKTGLI